MAALALATALLLFFLCLGAKPATAATFHSCASQKLENNGIFSLKASHAKCKVARQVAYARRSGDATPKGFSCVTGEGGNLTPFTCFRRDQVVKFSLEG
ncbi:MAG: hypothetical protein ACXWF9_08985 [Solirubrobacterales bacterium]